MKISGSNITDLALGSPRDVLPDDYHVEMPADVSTIIPLIQPLTVSAAGSVETIQSSFLKSNLVLQLAPATGQTITDFVTVAAGYWEFHFQVAAWFDYATVAAGAKSFAIGILPTDTGQTTQFAAMFAVIGTQTRDFAVKMLLRKGGTFRAVLGPTGAGQNISIGLSMIGTRLL